MKALQIFNKNNGRPMLIECSEEDGYYFDDRYYTKVAPPDGILTPCEFIEGKWQPLNDVPEKISNNEKDTTNNNNQEDFVADILLKQAESDLKVQKLEESNALLMLELAGGSENVLSKN